MFALALAFTPHAPAPTWAPRPTFLDRLIVDCELFLRNHKEHRHVRFVSEAPTRFLCTPEKVSNPIDHGPIVHTWKVHLDDDRGCYLSIFNWTLSHLTGRLREPDSTTLWYLQIGPEVEKIR